MSKKSSSSAPPVVIKDVVHKIQLCMLDGIKSETQLLLAASLLSKSDYNDVVTERSLAEMCGYPLCVNSLPSATPNNGKTKGGRYRISLKEHKVYDLLETRMYCSTKCTVDSRAYAESLEDERSLDLDTAKIKKVFDAFSLKGEDGLGDDYGLGKLSIKDKEDASVGGGVVSMEEWVGPSDAIEGYVPKHNKPPGSKLKGPKLKREKERIFDEMDFMSTIIMQDDGYSVSKEPFGPTKKSSSTTSEKSRKKKNHRGINDKLTLSADSCSAQKVPETKLNELNNEERESVTNDTPIGINLNSVERVKAPICDQQPSCSGLKSSLKSSGAIKTDRSVTWADEKTDENAKEITKGGSDIMNESIDDGDHAFRLASAEACAEALTQAAEAVASGESDAPDAVSEAGLVILPPPYDDDNEVVSSEGTVDPEPALLKWPKKNGFVEEDFLDADDSWFDSPPEEFVLDLSPFGTMFMSLFAWVSSSTLAYIYGRDDSFHEDYASINGREYPRKIVLTDGRSSEIRQTLAGCLSRALPGLVHHLRLPTPVSTIEYGMGSLLETMSFMDAVPGLRMKQWHVIVLLFVEALSVCRIPAIAPHLSNRRSFFQKVFDDGQVSREEYELLKDLILPLGRAPEFATQSGG